jgi:hypothetical protein
LCCLLLLLLLLNLGLSLSHLVDDDLTNEMK